ncbi:rRNA pseudouridine synthase [bacterium]|nr:rRNA pseudouridine synthase [bacterium]
MKKKKNVEKPLVRFLSQAGFGSRRHCDNLIANGVVTVNSEIAQTGCRVRPGNDTIKVKGEIAEEPPVLLYLLLNKPKGYLVSDSDPENRLLAKDLLPDFHMRMFPVGRLDFQTEGAILYTNDGIWANDIAHPSNTVPKTYLAKVRNIPSRSTLQRWTTGINDQGQLLKARSISIERTTGKNAWLLVTLTGGANRQVRRMGQATGHPVVKLIRLSIGGIELGTLTPGESRELTAKEIKSIRNQPEVKNLKVNTLSLKYKKRIRKRRNRGDIRGGRREDRREDRREGPRKQIGKDGRMKNRRSSGPRRRT